MFTYRTRMNECVVRDTKRGRVTMKIIGAKTSKQAALRYFLFGSSCLVSAPAALAQGQRQPSSSPMEEIVVTAPRFNTTDVSTVNKMAQPVIDTSQSINVLN